MPRPDLAEAIERTQEDLARRGAGPEALLIEGEMIRELAKGKPLSAKRASEVTGLSVELIEKSFEGGRRADPDNFTADGKVLGNAISLVPSRHHYRTGGKDLFAWCSYDAIFLPGLLGETAEIESICPETGEAIRARVAPDGVVSVSPPDAVLSIWIPGQSASGVDKPPVGPKSARCSSMFFFSSREAAERFLSDRRDLAILTVDEAYQLARRTMIEPYQQAKWGKNHQNDAGRRQTPPGRHS